MPATQPQHILITGGAGFLGAACARRLLDQGHTVHALDVDFSIGRLPHHPNLRCTTGDIRDANTVRQAVATADRVLHLAAIANVQTYISDPLAVLDTNLLGSREVLLAAHARQIPIVTASTSEVYGKNSDPLHEDSDSVYGPTTAHRWSYATSKRAAEHYAWALAKQGLTVAVVRYFNVYGPGLDRPGAGRVVSMFLGALQSGDPLHLVDGGHAVRCFCYIDDAADATVRLLLALHQDCGFAGTPFNIGNAEPVTMRELAYRMIALSGRETSVVDVPGHKHFGPGFEEIPRRVPDVSKLSKVLDFRASTSLHDGLRKTLAAYGLLARTSKAIKPEPIEVIRPIYLRQDRMIRSFRTSLRLGRTTNAGPEVVALESELAAWLRSPTAIATHSGAAGLEMALMAAGRSGKVALPSYTYVATLNAVERAGLTPVLIDIDEQTWTMHPESLAAALEEHPDISVVIPVCTFGVPPQLERIAVHAKRAGALVIYDAAHAMGVEYHGMRWSEHVDIAVYSLHATKVLPAVEGGFLLTQDHALADTLRALRHHGLQAHDTLSSPTGTNGKMDELSAAVARQSLAHFDHILSARRTYWEQLRSALCDAHWQVQHVPPDVLVNGQNLCAIPPVPIDAAAAQLADLGIATRRYFDPPLHHFKRCHAYAAFPHNLPNTQALWSSLLCLPLHSSMTEASLTRIARAIRISSEAP